MASGHRERSCAARARAGAMRRHRRGDEGHGSSASTSRAFSAARRWPRWIGSNVPPLRPIFTHAPPSATWARRERPRRAGARFSSTRPAPRHRRDRHHLEASGPASRRSAGSASARSARVPLGRSDELRPLEERRVPAAHLFAHGSQVARRIASVGARRIHHVQEHARALDVAQELEAEAVALVRAFDDPRDVRDHEGPVVQLDHAQDGRERRERVVGDLGAGGGEPRQQRRLAGVGQAEQADVRDQPRSSRSQRSSPGRAGLGLARRAVEVREERAVAAPAPSAARDHESLALASAPRRASSRSRPRARSCRAAR